MKIKIQLIALLLLIGAGCKLSAQEVKEAFAIEMNGANSEDISTLRNITYSYDEGTKVYTFMGLLDEGCDVQFHISNQSTTNNIKFDNGEEAEESPFTWLLPNPTGNQTLVAVFSHQDYTNSELRSFQTGFDESTGTGYIVVLDGSRSKISRVVKFGTGKHGEEVIEEVESIAAFKALAQSSKLNLGYNTPAKVYRINHPVTCIVDYVADNTWYYVQDETGTLGINSNHSFPLGTKNYKAGDQLVGITGYSVGTAADGYYMDLDAERFLVYDKEERDPEKEYTQFPEVSGYAEVAAPKEIRSKAEVTRQMNHDFVVLKGFTFEASRTEDEVNTLHCLKDADGNYFELSFDFVTIPPTDNKSEATNRFLESVADGATGDFTGFLSNNTKNLMIHSWEISDLTAIEEVGAEGRQRESRAFDLNGRRANRAHRGVFVRKGEKRIK